MPRKRSFKKTCADLKPVGGKGKMLGDPETEGLYLRMKPSGRKSWAVVARNPEGKQTWAKLADYDDRPGGLTLAAARDMVPMELARIRAGAPRARGADAGVLTLDLLADKFWKQRVTGKLREDEATRRLLSTYVLPFLGEHEVATLGRTAINQHLDLIEARELVVDGKRLGGEVVVDRVLSALSAMLKWHEVQVGEYTSPIIRGMARTSPAARARDRTLNDEELRALWTATAPGGAYNGLIRFLLLTAQRMGKCGSMQWDDIEDGVWHIRRADKLSNREKGTAGDLPLSPQALEVVNAQHRFALSDHVFAGRGAGPFAGISHAKRELDSRMASALAGAGRNTKLEPWRTHDLRRTARSLMPKAGVKDTPFEDLPKIAPHVCEITLGHSQPGLIKTYDRHDYFEEKKEAMETLGTIVDRIVAGRP